MRKLINELVWFGEKVEEEWASGYVMTLGRLFSEMYLYENEMKCGIFVPIVGDD